MTSDHPLVRNNARGGGGVSRYAWADFGGTSRGTQTEDAEMKTGEQLHRRTQFKLSSSVLIQYTTTFLQHFYPQCHARWASRGPSSSSGTKLVKNSGVRTSSSSTRPSKLVGQNDSMEDSLKNSTVCLFKLEDLLSTEIQGIGGSQSAGGCS